MRWLIAEEQLRTLRLKDAVLIAVLACAAAVFIYILEMSLSPAVLYYVFVAVFIFAMNCAVYILKKAGVALLFSVSFAVLTFGVDDIGIFGWKKVVVFLIAALIFEAAFLVLKLRLHSVPVDVVVGSALMLAALPLLAAFALSPSVVFSFPVALLNLVLVSFVAGLVASLVGFLLWHFVSRMKFVIRLEAYFGSL